MILTVWRSLLPSLYTLHMHTTRVLLYFKMYFIPKGSPRRSRVTVRLILERRLFQSQCLFPAFPNINAHALFATLEPECNAILVFAYRHDRSIHLISRPVHGLTDNGQYRKQPPLVQLALFGFFFGKGQDKFPSITIAGIFPTRFDAVPENRVIGIAAELGRRSQIVKDAPKGLDRIKRTTLL